jgi:hypothetical protein
MIDLHSSLCTLLYGKPAAPQVVNLNLIMFRFKLKRLELSVLNETCFSHLPMFRFLAIVEFRWVICLLVHQKSQTLTVARRL